MAYAGWVVLFCSVAATFATECLHFSFTRKYDDSMANDYYLETFYKEGKLFDACGHIYFISDYRIRDERLLELCATLEMSPLILEDLNETTCIAAEFAKGSFGKSPIWLPATAKGGHFKWCPTSNSATSIDNNTFTIHKIDSSKPDERVVVNFLNPELNPPKEDNCTNLKLVSHKGSKLVLAEERCSDVLERFVCKRKRNEYLNVFPGDDYLHLSQCAQSDNEKLKTVREALDLMKSQNSSFLELEDHTVVHKACGKVYFIIALDIQWKMAMQLCCKYGLKYLKLGSKEEMNCFTKALADTEDFNTFWTGAYNSGNKSEFKWLDGNVVDNHLWAKFQPEEPDVLRCATLNVDEWQTAHTGLQDTNCKAEIPVVCEI